MSLSKELVKKHQALHVEKFEMSIEYAIAEMQLKELAEIVRLTSGSEETK